jgi:hypothetical protein
MDFFLTNTIPIIRSGECDDKKIKYNPNDDNFASESLDPHPIDVLQRTNHNIFYSDINLDYVRRLYGSGLAMRLYTERHLASIVGGRLPGLDSHPDSMIMLNTLSGDDLNIDFKDFLGCVENRVETEKTIEYIEPHDLYKKIDPQTIQHYH